MISTLRASLAGAFVLAAGLFASGANAAVVCSTANWTTSTACQLGTDNNDNPLPGQVNADAMHGFSDWSFIEKHDGIPSGTTTNGSGVLANISFTGTAITGTWTFGNTNIWDDYDRIMIVVKGSNPNPYVGYLLADDVLGGTYTSPFSNARGNLQDISHISVYGHEFSGGVPEPSTWAMMLLGFAGLGFFGYRRRAKAAA